MDVWMNWLMDRQIHMDNGWTGGSRWLVNADKKHTGTLYLKAIPCSVSVGVIVCKIYPLAFHCPLLTVP